MVQGCLSGLLRSLTLVIRSVNQATSPEEPSKEDRHVVSQQRHFTQGRCTRGRARCEAGFS